MKKMSKELEKRYTPLQSLNNIRWHYFNNRDGLDYELEQFWFNRVETVLKEYELMKQTKFIVADKRISDEDLEKLKNQRMFISNLEPCEIKSLFDEEIQDKLNAFEIIKETRVDTNLIKLSKDYDDYCSMEAIKVLDCAQMTKQKGITQEEYNLLKEALK